MNFKPWFLTEDFNTQKAKYTAQGINPAIVDKYLADFRTIKDKKYKQINDPIHGLEHIKNRIDIDAYSDFRQLETLVDYVKGQTDVAGKYNYKNLKFGGTPIYEDQNIQIFYADSPKACIEYKGNAPYGWCIARTDSSNLFHSYRYAENQPAFYFVKNKDKTNIEFGLIQGINNTAQTGKFQDKYHFFVVQVVRDANPKNHSQKQYVVTSAENDGDKTMSWNEIIRIEPYLKGQEEKFQPKPLSQEESDFYDKYKDGTSDEEFAKLSYDQKDMYMNVYVNSEQGLTDKQYESLPEELKNKYIGLGVGLTDEQYNNTRDKLKKRYADVTLTKIKTLMENKLPLDLKSSEIKIFKKNIDRFDTNKLSEHNVFWLIYSACRDARRNGSIFKQEMSELLGQENIDKLSNNSVRELLLYAPVKKEIGELLGQDNINKLSSENVSNLMMFAKDKQEMAELLGEYNISKLSDKNVSDLLVQRFGVERGTLHHRNDKQEITKLILNYKKELSDNNVFWLIHYAKDKKEMAESLGMENISKLSNDNTRYLLNEAPDKDKQEIIKLILKHKKEISLEIFGYILDHTADKEKMKKFIIQNNKVSEDTVRKIMMFAKDR